MKLGIIGTNLYSVPPKGLSYDQGDWQGGYGGESQVHALVKALNKQGVWVELFSTPGSKAPELGSLHYLPQGDWFTQYGLERRIFEFYGGELFDCDVWHDWSLNKTAHEKAYMEFDKKCLMTPWGTYAPSWFARYNTVLWSDFHRHLFLDQGYPESTKYVWGSVDPDLYAPSYEPGEYFLYLSRVHPTKRTELVANLAMKMEFQLVVACDSESPDHAAYLQDLQRMTSGHENISYVVDPTFREKVELYRRAKALVLPSMQECFGLVVIEAMACGTPVILSNEGAYPEIVENGSTGFLCAESHHYEAAIKNVDVLDRRACRMTVERRFSSARMAKEYIEIYQRVGDGETF